MMMNNDKKEQEKKKKDETKFKAPQPTIVPSFLHSLFTLHFPFSCHSVEHVRAFIVFCV